MYQVQTDSQVREQLAALPIDAVLAFLEAVSVLELVPWNGTPVNPDNPDGALRTLPFGDGGLVTYLILEAQQRVDVVLVQWATLVVKFLDTPRRSVTWGFPSWIMWCAVAFPLAGPQTGVCGVGAASTVARARARDRVRDTSEVRAATGSAGGADP